MIFEYLSTSDNLYNTYLLYGIYIHIYYSFIVPNNKGRGVELTSPYSGHDDAGEHSYLNFKSMIKI